MSTQRAARRTTVNPGRRAAAEALLAVESGEHVEDALARLAPSDGADRALAWNAALGVLRRRSALDDLIRQAARRAVRTLDPAVLAVLRVGVFELRETRTPPHAAVDQAVELARALKVGHAAGFVNAVLRNQHGFTPDPEAALGHPAWLVHAWRARYGQEAADAWMNANNLPAPIFLVAKEDAAGVSRAFQHAGVALGATAEGVFRVPEGAGRPEEWPGYAEGRWWIMDPAAVAVADLLGPVDGLRVLDACAAPGGKTFRLASRGAEVLATDVDERRLERLGDGARRLGVALSVRAVDWAQAGATVDGAFDAAIVDAPCSGLGTLRRHPDARWRRRPEDLVANADRQRAILHAVARAVRPGGAIVYAVCSPEPAEGVEVARSLGWPIEAVFDNAPSPDGADVFWAARMRAPAGPPA